MKTENCANPIIVLDEIDKAGGSSRNGRVHDTLIQLLEPSSSSCILDEFLQARVNYSKINWIATANDTSYMPAPLVSRFKTVRVNGPKTREQFEVIIERTFNEFACEHGIRREFMPVLGKPEVEALKPYMTTPRVLAKATELLLSPLLSNPINEKLH